jgi:ferric iron reductase protein FhuF
LRHASEHTADGRFRRLSCCLIYRASPTNSRAAVCGDCVLRTS